MLGELSGRIGVLPVRIPPSPGASPSHVQFAPLAVSPTVQSSHGPGHGTTSFTNPTSAAAATVPTSAALPSTAGALFRSSPSILANITAATATTTAATSKGDASSTSPSLHISSRQGSPTHITLGHNFSQSLPTSSGGALAGHGLGGALRTPPAALRATTGHSSSGHSAKSSLQVYITQSLSHSFLQSFSL